VVVAVLLALRCTQGAKWELFSSADTNRLERMRARRAHGQRRGVEECGQLVHVARDCERSGLFAAANCLFVKNM
jgi:hypothetical protein